MYRKGLISAVMSFALVIALSPGAALADTGAADARAGLYAAEAAQSPFSFGAAGTVLAAGEYDVPVALKNANDITRSSGAASCVQGATLSVSSTGAATLNVRLGVVSMMGLTGTASDWKVYTTISDAEAYKAGARGTETIDAQVVSRAAYTDSAGVEHEYASEISFGIPNAGWDGVYVNMFVDAMNASPDAYLAIDYAQAIDVSAPRVYTGKAQVDQFGKYQVLVDVTVKDGKIASVNVKGDDFNGTYASLNETYLTDAASLMKDKWNGMVADQSNVDQIYQVAEVDAVSGATYSSKAIRDAIMDALGLVYAGEVINVPDELAAGTYRVDVSYYTDYAKHYLTGAEKTQALLTVTDDGALYLTVALANGTPAAPLYTMNVVGYYPENDRSAKLVRQGMTVERSSIGYTDAYFPEGTQVVTSVNVPLTGPLSTEYATRVYLYVPAMNALNGKTGDIEFDHGRFQIDALMKVYWDSRELVEQEKPVTPAVGDVCQVGGQRYRVTRVASDDSTGQVAFAKSKNKKSVVVPAKVTLPDGAIYTVTQVDSRAFSASKVRSVAIGARVSKLAPGAFKGSKATSVIVKSCLLKKKASVKGCFKGSKVGAVRVNAGSSSLNQSLLKAYKKSFTKANTKTAAPSLTVGL